MQVWESTRDSKGTLGSLTQPSSLWEFQQLQKAPEPCGAVTSDSPEPSQQSPAGAAANPELWTPLCPLGCVRQPQPQLLLQTFLTPFFPYKR